MAHQLHLCPPNMHTCSRRGLKRPANQAAEGKDELDPWEVWEDVKVEPEPVPDPAPRSLQPRPPSGPPPAHLYEKAYSLRQHVLDVAAKGEFWMPLRYDKPLVPGLVDPTNPQFKEEHEKPDMVPKVIPARFDVKGLTQKPLDPMNSEPKDVMETPQPTEVRNPENDNGDKPTGHDVNEAVQNEAVQNESAQNTYGDATSDPDGWKTDLDLMLEASQNETVSH